MSAPAKRTKKHKTWYKVLEHGWDFDPNFADYVKSCGGLGVRVDNKKELPVALENCLGHSDFSLVEIMADPELI